MSKTLRELFEAAILLPAPDRAAFAEAQCADPASRAHLLRMLEIDHVEQIDQSDDLGANGDLALALAAAIGDSNPILNRIGAQVGPYTIEAHIGDGGSSVIYRASRPIEGVAQMVALKILRRGMHAPEARRLFDRERHALAALQHPFIAQLIDGGVDASGQAYLALELVDGVPITEYARSRSLDFRARLKLFRQVALAVAAAHRALVVHRDLKPANILVTHDGYVKLLDFGIAKLMGDEHDLTQTKFQAFTPAYAAPEQRANGPITTATDVYALGIVLGELLTGQRVHEGSKQTPSTHISEDTAPGVLPSTPQQMRRLLRGDVDNIVLKALEIEPERRYRGAAEFADDIERLLDGQPVKAHPPSVGYRASKFVRRNRVSVALVGLLVLALLGTTGTALWQAKLARLQSANAMLESQRAGKQAKRAEQMSAFLGSIFSGVQPVQRDAQPPSLSALVQRAARKAQDGLSDDPEAAVNLLITAGNIFDDLSDSANVKRMYVEAVRRAEKSLPIENDERLFAISALAEFSRVEESLDEAEALLKATAAALPQAAKSSKGRAVFTLTYGKLERTRGRVPEATDRLNRAVLECESEFGANSYELMDALSQRSVLLMSAADVEGAAVDMERAYAISKTDACAQSDCGPVVAANYADLLIRQGNYAQGRALHMQAAEIMRRAYPDPNLELANSLDSIAVSFGYEQLWAPSEALLRASLLIRQAAGGLDDEGAQTTQLSLGRVLQAQGKALESTQLLTQVLAHGRKTLDANSPKLATILNFLANAETKAGLYASAKIHAVEALAIIFKINGENNARTAGAITTLAELAERQNNLAEALALALRAVAAAGSESPKGGQPTWPARVSYARIACALQKPDAPAEFGKIWAEISVHPQKLTASELYLLDQAQTCMTGASDRALAMRMLARQKLLRTGADQRVEAELQKMRAWLAQMDALKPDRD